MPKGDSGQCRDTKKHKALTVQTKKKWLPMDLLSLGSGGAERGGARKKRHKQQKPKTR